MQVRNIVEMSFVFLAVIRNVDDGVCYICSKLMSFYDEMTEEFARVSHCFKYGNLMVFVEDMTHYLSDLLYTKGTYNTLPFTCLLEPPKL